MTTLIADGYQAGTPALQHAVSVFRHGDMPGDEQLRWLFAATRGAVDVWDDESWRELSIRQVELARAAGALSLLPFALCQEIAMHLHAGELTTAASLVREFAAVKKATSAGVPDFGAMLLAAWQGRSRDALWLIEEIVSDMDTRGRGFGVSIAHYAASVLRNGLGQYEDALASAELAVSHPEDLGFANLALAELIEAPYAAVGPSEPPSRGSGSPRSRSRQAPRGDSASRRAPAHCSARAISPIGCTRRRSPAWARRQPAPSSPARTCSTASGCTPRTAAARHASTCRPRTACCRRWRSARSATGPGGCWLPLAGRAARGRCGYFPPATH